MTFPADYRNPKPGNSASALPGRLQSALQQRQGLAPDRDMLPFLPRLVSRLYTSKLPITAVHLPNKDLLPAFEAANTRIEVVLSDNVLSRETARRMGRPTWFATVEEMRTALDAYLVTYNEKRPYHGRGMKGRTPMQVFFDGRPKSTSSRKETPKRHLDPNSPPPDRRIRSDTVSR